jgi:hypothetical protein
MKNTLKSPEPSTASIPSGRSSAGASTSAALHTTFTIDASV